MARRRRNDDGGSDYQESEHPRGAGGRWVDKPDAEDGDTGDIFDRLANADLGDMGKEPHLITSQHFLDEDVVNAKIAAGDFDVQVSPEFEIDGRKFRVVLDGHHSLAAAVLAKKAPSFTTRSSQDDDRVGFLDNDDVNGFLEATWMDGEYIYALKRNPVW